MGMAHPEFTAQQRRRDPGLLITSPPYARVSDYYRRRAEDGGTYQLYPRSSDSRRTPWSSVTGGQPLPLWLEVTDDEIGHSWRFRTASGELEIQPAFQGWTDSYGVFQYAYVYHLAVEGTVSALRGSCTCHLRQRAFQHFRLPRTHRGGGVNPRLIEHVLQFLREHGRPPEVTLHVLWKGSAVHFRGWLLRAVEQAFVEAAVARELPLFNQRYPLRERYLDFVSEVHREALLPLVYDPSEIVRDWVRRVLADGWRATAVGTRMLDTFCGSGQRFDWNPAAIDVQSF